ncbi:hypothetical protein EV424DRAFT_1344946 [Suillus variegatus]|nr:hypothetical protein EV424DRAFT_1344946 [Suillus variegatus]
MSNHSDEATRRSARSTRGQGGHAAQLQKTGEMLAAPSRRTQKETTLDIGDAEENPMAPSQLWKLKKNAMATTKTQHSVGAKNKANPEAQHPGVETPIRIQGAAFPRNARHARTIPTLRDVYARARIPTLARPMAPAIQMHPSTVHQAPYCFYTGASLRPVLHKMYSSGRFGFWKPTSTSSQSIQKAIQSSNHTLKEARGKAAESDTSDNNKDQGRIDDDNKQIAGMGLNETQAISWCLASMKGIQMTMRILTTSLTLKRKTLMVILKMKPGTKQRKEVFNVLERHQAKNRRHKAPSPTAPSLLVNPHLDMWCLGLLLQCNIPDATKLEMHLQAILTHPVPEHQDALQLAQEVINTELWIYHEKKIKLDNSYFLQYQIQMAQLLCDDLFTFRTELKKVIISITKTSYGIFPKGTVTCKEEMQKSVTANTTKLLKTGDYLHSPGSSDGRWKNFVSQALKDSCLEFYYSNSKKALKNTEEFQHSIPVNGLLLVAIMIKGVITGFRETGTDKVPDLSADKYSLVDNPERGRELEEMLEEWPMTGMGDHYFDDDDMGGSDMEDVNVIP